MPAHLQYFADRFTHHLNRLALSVQTLDCLAERAKTKRYQIISQFSPVLAAKAAGFPECSHLKSFGQFGLLSRCTVIAAKVEAKWTACGHQPFWRGERNFTLQADGKTVAFLLIAVVIFLTR